MRSRPGNTGKGVSLARASSSSLDTASPAAFLAWLSRSPRYMPCILALPNGGEPAVIAGLSLAVIVVCWLTMPANRPHVGALILRVEMVASLAVGVFVARRLLFGRSPVLGGEVFTLIVTAAGFVIGLCIARGTHWGRKWAR